MGTPSNNSRKALHVFVSSTIASSSMNPDDEDMIGRTTAAIRLRAAFALVRALGEELFRNPGRDLWADGHAYATYRG